VLECSTREAVHDKERKSQAKNSPATSIPSVSSARTLPSWMDAFRKSMIESASAFLALLAVDMVAGRDGKI
jgi:hypothetical protein